MHKREGLPWHLSLSGHVVAGSSRLVVSLRSPWYCFLVRKLEIGWQWGRRNSTCNCSPGMFRERGEVG